LLDDCIRRGWIGNPYYKLLLLGDSGSGKTAILKHLCHGSTDNQCVAHVGKELTVRTVTLPLSQCSLVQLMTQDGFQEVGSHDHVHLTVFDPDGRHALDCVSEMCMSNFSLIGIVHDLRNSLVAELKRWLELIALRSPDCGIILFATHADKLKSSELMTRMQQLRSDFCRYCALLCERTQGNPAQMYLEGIYCLTNSSISVYDVATTQVPTKVETTMPNTHTHTHTHTHTNHTHN
jgi:GTPase SAR1 family protein